MLPLLAIEDTVAPEGSEALFEPKNHSKLGVGTFSGRGFGTTPTEHCRLKFSPTILVVVPGRETLTASMSTVHGKQMPGCVSLNHRLCELVTQLTYVHIVGLTDILSIRQFTAETSSFHWVIITP